nr:hypothetical protein [Desulfobacterales bacterium]
MSEKVESTLSAGIVDAGLHGGVGHAEVWVLVHRLVDLESLSWSVWVTLVLGRTVLILRPEQEKGCPSSI